MMPTIAILLLMGLASLAVPVLTVIVAGDRLPWLSELPAWGAFLAGGVWTTLISFLLTALFDRYKRAELLLRISVPAMAVSALVLAAAVTGQLPFARAAGLLVAATLALSFGQLALTRISLGEMPGFEAHWGGLGGGLGGWRLSPAAAYLLLALTLVGIAATLAVPAETPKQEEPPPARVVVSAGEL
jgi:hypothetical protein